jgi:hypothetical protein
MGRVGTNAKPRAARVRMDAESWLRNSGINRLVRFETNPFLKQADLSGCIPSRIVERR